MLKVQINTSVTQGELTLYDKIDVNEIRKKRRKKKKGDGFVLKFIAHSLNANAKCLLLHLSVHRSALSSPRTNRQFTIAHIYIYILCQLTDQKGMLEQLH